MMWKLSRVLFCLSAIAAFCSAADPVRLTGAGSTFIHPILSKWSKEYRQLHPDVEIYYEGLGSGKGISQTLAGLVDFGGSDGPATDQQLEHARVKVLHIPVTIGAVVPAYNLPGVNANADLRFTGTALAGIFIGKIKRWNDPILIRTNPGVRLPDKEIYVVSRLDSSGTTYIWTDYLSKVSPEWDKQLGRGTKILFPVGNGTQFNEGVVESIKKNPYSIGYLQTTYAIDNPDHVRAGRVRRWSFRQSKRRWYNSGRRNSSPTCPPIFGCPLRTQPERTLIQYRALPGC